MEVSLWTEDIEIMRTCTPDMGSVALQIATKQGAVVNIIAHADADLWDFACKIQNALHDLGEEESGE